MHYYIDGYNWLFRTPKSRKSFEEKRREFIKNIHTLVEGRTCLVTIVFDSSDPSRDLCSKGNYDFLEIVFTPKKQTADQYIESAVENATKPRLITVVTLDRELQQKCMLRGANIVTMEEFFDIFTKNKNKSRKKKDDTKESFQETRYNIARLLTIFEKRLFDDIFDTEK
ncbi:MAG: hypothetical protein FJZ57_01745 [Chlamydiae bacterium]|nr:hypothetical protein [Chlamydiota bacterium]